jgi:hypothetical protein
MGLGLVHPIVAKARIMMGDKLSSEKCSGAGWFMDTYLGDGFIIDHVTIPSRP